MTGKYHLEEKQNLEENGNNVHLGEPGGEDEDEVLARQLGRGD